MAPVKNVHGLWGRVVRNAFIAGPLRTRAAFRCLGDGRKRFRVSCVGVTEGERCPAMIEMVASALVATDCVGLVAMLATGECPSLFSSF